MSIIQSYNTMSAEKLRTQLLKTKNNAKVDLRNEFKKQATEINRNNFLRELSICAINKQTREKRTLDKKLALESEKQKIEDELDRVYRESVGLPKLQPTKRKNVKNKTNAHSRKTSIEGRSYDVIRQQNESSLMNDP